MSETPLTTPRDDLIRIMYFMRRKHPDWSGARIRHCSEYALFHPKEKIKQSDSETYKPNQISFDDLMKRGACYG